MISPRAGARRAASQPRLE